jgi:C4-dicarboxylate transporter, DctM subunit
VSLLATSAMLIVLLFLRMPVAFATGFAGLVGLIVELGFSPAFAVLEKLYFDTASSFILVSVPLFILMAELLTAGDITRRAVYACQTWVGHIRGGLAVATVGASVMLAALVGSSTASAATMAASAFPEMRRYKYDERLASAIVSVGGTLAVMIPPSIVLVVYGILTETSIGKLFIAGLIPGLLTAVGLIVTVQILARKKDMAPKGVPFELKHAVRSSLGVWPAMILIGLIVGVIYTGVASPTESAALGVGGAFILGIAQRKLKFDSFNKGVSNAVRTTVMIIAIIACSHIFANFLAFTQVTDTVLKAVETANVPGWVILSIMIVILLLMGMMMDQLAILALTMPLIFPTAMSFGYDPVWLGIVITKTVEIGLITPPLGLNAYVVAGQTGVPLNTVFRGLFPFIITEIVVLVLLIAFPDITLWLTTVMW